LGRPALSFPIRGRGIGAQHVPHRWCWTVVVEIITRGIRALRPKRGSRQQGPTSSHRRCSATMRWPVCCAGSRKKDKRGPDWCGRPGHMAKHTGHYGLDGARLAHLTPHGNPPDSKHPKRALGVVLLRSLPRFLEQRLAAPVRRFVKSAGLSAPQLVCHPAGAEHAGGDGDGCEGRSVSRGGILRLAEAAAQQTQPT
jgi:hypothetical protein